MSRKKQKRAARPGRKARANAKPRMEKHPLVWALAQVLRLFRLDKGWSQQFLADKSGVSRQMIGDIEAQEKSPTTPYLAWLAQALGMHADELLRWARMLLLLTRETAAG